MKMRNMRSGYAVDGRWYAGSGERCPGSLGWVRAEGRESQEGAVGTGSVGGAGLGVGCMAVGSEARRQRGICYWVWGFFFEEKQGGRLRVK